MSESTVACAGCGAQMDVSWNFCEQCGRKLRDVCPQCWKLDHKPGRCATATCGEPQPA